jgi:hypothetical protein
VLDGRLRAARLACEQAGSLITELAPLKNLRRIVERLDMVLLQLEGIPPLQIETRGLRLDSHGSRALLKSLDGAAQASTDLTKSLNRLLATAPGSQEWNQAQLEVLRHTDLIAQHVRERRDVR